MRFSHASSFPPRLVARRHGGDRRLARRIRARGSTYDHERADTVIVGAGQAGLATGYYLAAHGHDFVIVDGHERPKCAYPPARGRGTGTWLFQGETSRFVPKRIWFGRLEGNRADRVGMRFDMNG